MIVLDTQPVSQLQRAGSRDATRLEQRLEGSSFERVCITVITPYEQLKEALGLINSKKDPAKQAPYFVTVQSPVWHPFCSGGSGFRFDRRVP